MNELGDVKINGKWYRINIESYRDRDVIDFSPRASSPGGGMVMSDLMLYQPLMQTDWKHGFGFSKFEDAEGYYYTVGSVDTRHDGMAMLFTNKVSSDTTDGKKIGAVMHHEIPYFYGPHGIRKYTEEGWEAVTASTEPNTLHMLSLGNKLFASPYNSRLRMSGEAGKLVIQKGENKTDDTFMRQDNPTTSYKAKATLRVGTNIANNHMTSFLKFNLEDWPTGATLDSATMNLRVLEKTTTVPNIHVARCLREAVENEIKWTAIASGSDWGVGGGTESGADISSTDMFADAMTAEAGADFSMTLDTAEVTAMIASNNGMIIYEEYTGEEVQNVKFAGAGDANKEWRPELILKYTLATDWEDAGTNVDSKNYHWSCVFNGFVYAGIINTNRIHYSSNEELADLEGTADDPSAIKVGANTSGTIGAINFLGSMYISKPDGLWQMGEDKIARRVLDFTSEVSDENFNTMAIHNGYLIFPIRDTLYQWNGYRLNVITPEKISDSWPFTTYGRFQNLLTVGDYLYCTARTNETTYSEALLCYDGIGWHKLADLITDGLGSISLLFYDTTNDYLWIHKDLDDPVTYYIPFQTLSKYPYAAFPITGTHSLYSCIHDMGFARIFKSSPSLLLEGSNLSTASYLLLYFKRDTDVSWIPWGQMLEDGVKEFTLPAGLRTIEYKSIQLRVDFVTTTATETPILNGMTLRFLMRPEVAYGWNFDIIAADHFVYGEREDLRTAAKIIADIRAARNSKAPLEFIDLEGNTQYVYISSFSGTAQERNVDEENGLTPSIESVLNINLVEAK